jgi:uncharacterized repeat protein (TIGR01451 family)
MPKTHLHSTSARLGAALLLWVAFGPIGLGPAASTALAATVPAPNPPIAEACGVNVTLVLDASGSIESAGAVGDVRDSARAFLDALADTNSRARVVDFGTVARQTAPMDLVTTASLQPGGRHATALSDYYNPKPPLQPGESGHRYKGSGSVSSTGSYQNGSDPQYTNWDQALHLSRGDATNLIVFVTDGEPSAMDADQPGDPFYKAGQNPPNVLYGLDSGSAINAALDRAVQEANVAKSQGTRIMAIGVGSAFGSGSNANRDRLIQVAGPQVVTDATQITDLNAVDVAMVEDFGQLQAVLRSVVTQLCSPSLTIRKVAQAPGDATFQPAAGWSITVDPAVSTVANPPFSWVQPAGAPVGPATIETDANGFVNFQWDPLPPSSTTVAHVTEESRPSYLPQVWQCAAKDAEGRVVETSGSLDPVAPGFDVTVGPENIVTCTIENAFTYAPGIAVTKTNSPTRLRGDGAGTSVTSTYVVTNTGNTPVKPVNATDDRCAPVTYVSGDTNGNQLLDATEAWKLSCTRIVTSATGPAPVVIDNTITVGGVAPDGTTVTASSAASVTVLAPDIVIAKTASPTQLVGPGNVDYTFDVTTNGNMPIKSVVVTDDQCAPVKYGSGDANADGVLDPGETWVFACSATVSESTVDTATVTGQPVDQGSSLGGPVTDSTTAQVEVLNATVALTKTAAPNLTLPGQPVTYTFVVTNTSGDGTVLVPVTPGGRDAVVNDGTCSPVTYVSGDTNDDSRMADGEAWTYACTRMYSATGAQVNVATANLQVEGTTTNVRRQAIAAVLVVGPAVDLTKEASRGMVHSGDSVTYTYQATNPSLVPLANVTVTDDTCAPVTYVSGDKDADGRLDRGEAWTFSCTTTLAKPVGSDPAKQVAITNTATVAGTPRLGGQTGPPVTDQATAKVIVIEPSVAVTKVADPTEVRLGSPVTYTFTVTNTGDTDLFYGQVEDNQCSPLSYVSGDTGREGIASPGEVWTYTCTTVPSASTIDTVDVVAIDPLGKILRASARATVDVFDPAISLNKSVSDSLVPSGTVVTYTLIGTNTGIDPLTNVVLVDPACANLVLISSGNGDTTMDVGEAWTWTCRGSITTPITNVAAITANGPGTTRVADLDFADVTPFDPGIHVTKTATPRTVLGSGLVTYTYRVTNTGDVPLANVRTSITDDTCPDVKYVSGDVDGNDLLTGSSDIFETGPPETWTFTCSVEVSHDTTNTVDVTGTPSEAGPTGLITINPDVADSATATVNVVIPGTIVIAKDLVGGMTGTASFTGDLGRFTLDVSDGTNQRTFDGLAPGTYDVSESSTPGWALSSITCDDPSGGTTISRPLARIVLAEGETVTCTFTNANDGAPSTDAGPTVPPVVSRLVAGWSPGVVLGAIGLLASASFLLLRRRRPPRQPEPGPPPIEQPRSN